MQTVLNLLRRCGEYIFPERLNHRIVRELDFKTLQIHLRLMSHDSIVSLLPFNEPCVRALIHEAKFKHNEKAWRLLGETLSSYLKHCPTNTVLIPIPLFVERKHERGYNQTEEILKQAIRLTPHLQMAPSLLKRVRDTKPQTTLSRLQRIENMEDAFVWQPTKYRRYQHSASPAAHIIVVDDVATTGSTLKAAEAALRPLTPNSITLLALAR